MRPELVELMSRIMPADLAGLVAPTWFTFVGLAGIATLLLMLRASRAAGIDRGVVAGAILWGYLAAVVAGIAIPMVIDVVEHLFAHGQLRVRWAGMTSFWGYLAGGTAVALVARRGGVSLGRLGDLAAAPLGIALYLARFGCFLAGCDFGKVSSAPWAIRFPKGSPAWHDHVNAGLVPSGRTESLPVHPTQLYESIWGLVIFAVALLVARTGWAKGRHGRVALVAIAMYAIGRFGIEMLRGDVGRGFFGPLSSGQVFSVAVLAAIAIGTMWTRWRRPVTLAAAAAMGLMLSAAPRHAHAQNATQPGAAPESEPRFAVGVLAGVSAPLNRRGGQVPPMAGPTLSMGYFLPHSVSAWLDFDSLGNEDATHGSLMMSLQWEKPVRGKWSFAPRFGVGTTLVNFDTAAFRDVTGITMRAEASLELELSPSWVLWLRPVTFDLLSANDLGGPIFSWQFRVGVGYQKHRAKTAAVKPQPQPMAPGQYPPPVGSPAGPSTTPPYPPPGDPGPPPPVGPEQPMDPYR